MKLTHEERRKIHAREALDIVSNAYKEGKKFTDIRDSTFTTGTKFRSYIETVGGIFPILDELGIPFDSFCSQHTITSYYIRTMAAEQAEYIVRKSWEDSGEIPTVNELTKCPKLSAASKILVKIHGSFTKAMLALGVKPRAVDAEYITSNKDRILEMYLEGHSGARIEETLSISRSTVYSILREYGINATDSDLLATRSDNRSSVSAGHLFEAVVGELLTDLGIIYTKYDHGELKPDFVTSEGWIDAKLTHKTGRGNCLERYTEEAKSVEFLYLIGPKRTRLTPSGIKKTSVHIYLNQLSDKTRVSYYLDKFQEIKEVRDKEVTEYSRARTSTEDKIIQSVESGMSMRKTSEVLGINLSTVSTTCKKYGVKSKAKYGRNARKESIA